MIGVNVDERLTGLAEGRMEPSVRETLENQHLRSGTVETSMPEEQPLISSGADAGCVDANGGTIETQNGRRRGLGMLLPRGLRGATLSAVRDEQPKPEKNSHNWFSTRNRKHGRAGSADAILVDNVGSPGGLNGSGDQHLHPRQPAASPSSPSSHPINEKESEHALDTSTTDSPWGPGCLSAPASTHASPTLQPNLLTNLPSLNGFDHAPDPATATAPAIPLSDKKSSSNGHRRHRSLLGSLGWTRPLRTKSVESGAEEMLQDGDSEGFVASTPNGFSGSNGSSSLHGYGQASSLPVDLKSSSATSLDIDSLKVERPPIPVPPATRGIANVGNTCFIGAALQCLAHTPGLPYQIMNHAALIQSAKGTEGPETSSPDGAVEQSEEAMTMDKLPPDNESDHQENEPQQSLGEEDKEMDETTGSLQTANGLVVSNGGRMDSNAGQSNEEKAGGHPAHKNQASDLPSRPSKGELTVTVAALMSQLFVMNSPAASPPNAGVRGVNPIPLLQLLRKFPVAADYFRGGQQDCQEVLQMLLDLLHEDMSSSRPLSGECLQGSQDEKPPHDGDERAKGDEAWNSWLSKSRSPISDLCMGQLQSSVTCSNCGNRFTMYEAFWELSLPLVPKSGNAFTSWLGIKSGGRLTLEDCLRAFTEEEKLEGEEAFFCETCKYKTPATKLLRIHRLPDVLILHIKRFRQRGAGVDKLTTDVNFPLSCLELWEQLSPESPHDPEECCYDLFAVSYHTGSLAGGHYRACCRVPMPQDPSLASAAWWEFNDESVFKHSSASNVLSQQAYILFYARRKFKDASRAASVFALRAKHAAQQSKSSRHRRSRSHGGSSKK